MVHGYCGSNVVCNEMANSGFWRCCYDVRELFCSDNAEFRADCCDLWNKALSVWVQFGTIVNVSTGNCFCKILVYCCPVIQIKQWFLKRGAANLTHHCIWRLLQSMRELARLTRVRGIFSTSVGHDRRNHTRGGLSRYAHPHVEYLALISPRVWHNRTKLRHPFQVVRNAKCSRKTKTGP